MDSWLLRLSHIWSGDSVSRPSDSNTNKRIGPMIQKSHNPLRRISPCDGMQGLQRIQLHPLHPLFSLGLPILFKSPTSQELQIGPPHRRLAFLYLPSLRFQLRCHLPQALRDMSKSISSCLVISATQLTRESAIGHLMQGQALPQQSMGRMQSSLLCPLKR